LEKFLEISGILFWIIIAIVAISILLFGKKWYLKLGLSMLSLNKFNDALQKLYSEIPNNVKKETVSEVTGTLFWRITRIGLLTLGIASIPIILLFQQNQLIKSQNILFQEQNGMITAQSDLLKGQNILIKNQIRPYVSITSDSDHKNVTLISVLNAPAFIDSLIIEYHVKDFGDNPFVLIHKQTEYNFTIYPVDNQIFRIKTNVLTEKFMTKLKSENQRLMKRIIIYYSNMNDETTNSEILSQYKVERTYFLSKISDSWYLKEEIDSE